MGVGIAKNMPSKDIEWALAGFELDNLSHQTYNFARQSHVLRRTDPHAEHKIYIQYQLLEQAFESWKQRSIVIEQEELEQYFREIATPSPELFNRFLHYEYIPLLNHFYAKLLNQWRASFIYAALVLPFPDEDVLTRHAVDICRTTAALGYNAFSGPQWECLFYAGIVLGQAERDWIVDRCWMVAAMLPVLSPHIERLEKVWTECNDDWNMFGRLYPREEERWFKYVQC
jgi:hypothetical protein